MLSFDKIQASQTLSLEFGGCLIKARLERLDFKNILLKANIQGELIKPCDLCQKEDVLKINENIELILHDGLYKDEDNKLSDLYECMDKKIDLEEIFHSELELILFDYFYCKDCIKE